MVLQNTIKEEREARAKEFRAQLKQRIMLLDCAMGNHDPELRPLR
jgi:hypothetical protein